jgi:hypothetical protein
VKDESSSGDVDKKALISSHRKGGGEGNEQQFCKGTLK